MPPVVDYLLVVNDRLTEVKKKTLVGADLYRCFL